MQLNLLWTGREYYSLENCLIDITDKGSQIQSTIVGMYQEKIYRVEYKILTNQNWETLFVELQSRHSNVIDHLQLEGDGKGNWIRNGMPADNFKGCIDVDLPLTPFTNTLPIRRLKLTPGAQDQIRVIYLDMLERRITPVQQKYVRRSDHEYHYENVPNDFEATIMVDEHGLVVDYPHLFVRTAALETSFQV